MHKNIKALTKLRPGSGFIWKDPEDFSTLSFSSKIDSPSFEEIKKQAIKDEEDFKNSEYSRNRQAKYPSIQECVHALLDGGVTLTKLQEQRSAIKKEFPKPE